MTEDFSIVDQEPFPESGLLHRKLTERLGCTEMRVNSITLAPGQATAPHSHERQEEVYRESKASAPGLDPEGEADT